jgi:cytochrome c
MRERERIMRIRLLTVATFVLLAAAPWANAQQAPPTPLRNLADDQVVRAVAYCRSEYALTMASGAQHRYPEFNLRFKTDCSRNGPESGKPALLPAGMRGDRAQVIFASPEELKRFLVERC